MKFLLYVGLIIALVLIGGIVVGWPAMILFGNLHVLFPAVPALSFTQSLSIAWPAVLIIGACMNGRVNVE